MKFKALHFAFLFVLLLSACQQSGSKATKPNSTEQGTTPSASTGNLAWACDQDPVCDMKIDQTAEDTVHYGGKVYGFCGPDCKAKFQENPAKYVSK